MTLVYSVATEEATLTEEWIQEGIKKLDEAEWTSYAAAIRGMFCAWHLVPLSTRQRVIAQMNKLGFSPHDMCEASNAC